MLNKQQVIWLRRHVVKVLSEMYSEEAIAQVLNTTARNVRYDKRQLRENYEKAKQSE